MPSSLLTSLRVGLYLAIRELRRASKWTTGLIIFVMMLTFLNLIVVRGLLVGLISGSISANKDFYSADVLVSNYNNQNFIQNSYEIEDAIKNFPGTKQYAIRYIDPVRLESGYKEDKRPDQKNDNIGSLIAGIDIQSEEQITQLSSRLIDGEFITPDDIDAAVVGASVLAEYSSVADAPIITALRRVKVGDKIHLIVNNHIREITIKGVIKTKAQAVDGRIYMNAPIVRQLIGRNDLYADEIAVTLNEGYTDTQLKDYLVNASFEDRAVIRTSLEAVPQFVKDIQVTFNILGNAIGSIGLAVSSITIFIVIFVNAITRRKYIGILKGIGITSTAIQVSYVLQALFYAIIGIIVATVVIVAIIKPYFVQNPIDFPFSDGIIVAENADILLRGSILLIATLIAGFIPAYIVIRQNTLDAILGR